MPHGLFVGDTRVLSGLASPSTATARGARRGPGDGAAATFVGRTGTSGDRRRLLVVRRRTLDPVLCEEIELAARARADRCNGALRLGRGLRRPVLGEAGPPPPARRAAGVRRGDALCFDWVLGVVRRNTSLRVAAHEAPVRWRSTTAGSPGRSPCRRATASRRVDGRRRARRRVGRAVARAVDPRPRRAKPGRWIEDAPTLDTDDPALARAYRRSLIDLAALRLFDPSGRRLPVVAAGAPWFMTLFGATRSGPR